MIKLRFNVGGGYDAVIGSGARKLLCDTVQTLVRGENVALVADRSISAMEVREVAVSLNSLNRRVSLLGLKGGENGKSLTAVEELYGRFHEFGMTRSDVVISLGGGVTGDITGFAAATYLRGVAHIAMPTTIIAQTDSAYGGKTGVDYMGVKNLIGTFTHPKAVICDTDYLKNLPESERISGMGEVLKYGAVADGSILDSASRELPTEELIADCVNIKKKYVEEDEFDRAERHVLNFGHTFGHAIEAASGYKVPHGQAVAYGMLLMIRVGERLGVTNDGVYDRLESAMNRVGLDTRYETRLEGVRKFLLRDKKTDAGLIDAVLLKDIGEPVRMGLSPDELLKAVR